MPDIVLHAFEMPAVEALDYAFCFLSQHADGAENELSSRIEAISIDQLQNVSLDLNSQKVLVPKAIIPLAVFNSKVNALVLNGCCREDAEVSILADFEKIRIIESVASFISKLFNN